MKVIVSFVLERKALRRAKYKADPIAVLGNMRQFWRNCTQATLTLEE
jgi:hypothetical protein